MASSNIAKLFVEIGFKDKQLRTGLRNAERSVSRLNTSLTRMNSALGSAVSRSFWALTGAVTGFMAASATVGARFDREMTFVGAIANSTGDELQQLTDKARELGATTMYTATQSASAMQNFARAGMETNEILSATGPALMLAGAAGESMDLSTQTLAATMAQFNAQGYEAGSVADVFATALTGSLFDLRSLTEAMKYGGTVGANFGMSLEETTAALAQFRNLGLEGSLAGTNFRMSMAHAAKATDKARNVLARYGLTAQDINPEIHSFGQIMETVGKASMTTTDLLEVFGRRAGANIAGISKQFADGSTDFYNLLGDIEGSAGAVESLYERSTANVLDRFKIVQSAFQELLLTTFDQYKEPAMGLLEDLTKMINNTTAEVNNSSSEISAAMNELFSYIQGQMMFMEGGAGSLVTAMISGFTEVMIVLQLLFPYLDDIFQLLLTMWAVGKVVAFTNAIISLINSVGALRTAFVAVRTTMLAMMGPKGWLIAGIGAVVGGIASMVGAWNDNRAAIEANQAAAERLQAIEAQGAQDRSDAIGEAVSLTNTWAGQTLLRLEGEEKIDRVYERELQRLSQMTQAQIEQGVAAGQLIPVLEAGGTVYKSINLLVHDMAQGNIDAHTSQNQLNVAIRDTKQQLENTNKEQEAYSATLSHIMRMFDVSSQSGLDSLSNVQEKMLKVEANARNMSHNWRDWVVGSNAAANEADRLEQLLKNILLVQDRSVISAQRFEQALSGAGAQAEENAQDEKERENRRKQWRKDYESAIEARQKMESKIETRYLDAVQTRTQIVAREYKEQVDAANAVFDEELRLVGRNTQKRQEIEEKREAALTQLREAALEERYNIMQEVARETGQRMISERERSERESLIYRQRQERQVIVQQLQENLAIADVTEAGKREIWAESARRLRSARTAHELELAQYDRGIAKQTADFIAQLKVDSLGPLHTEIMKLELELEQAIAENVNASEAHKDQIRDEFAKRRKNLVQSTENDILVFLGRANADVIRLEAEKQETLANLTEETEQYRAAIILQYDALIAQARAKGPDDPLTEEMSKLDKFILAMSESAKKSFKALRTQFGFFAQTAYDDIGIVTDSVDFMNGAIQDVGDFLSPAAAKVRGWGATAIGAFKAAGAAIVDTEQQATGPFMGTLEAVGEGFYQVGKVGVQGAKMIGSGFGALAGQLIKVGKAAVAVGKFVSGVADKMGAMFNKALDGLNALTGFDFSLIDSVGDVNDVMAERAELEAKLASGDLDEEEKASVQAELDALPANAAEASREHVTGMVDAAIQMVQTFAEAAPALLQTLAAKIPDLLNEVAAQLPIIIQALATTIPQVVFAVVGAIPAIVEALAANLPTLFQRLFELIPTVIYALMDAVVLLLPAVGEIIAMFIAEVPNIVFAVLDSLPDLMLALMDQIQVIIAALVEMIPQLIHAVATALPGIIETLIDIAINLVMFLIEQAPILVQGVVDKLPFLIYSIISSIPVIINKLVSALPDIVTALIEAIPTIIRSVIDAIPMIIIALVAAIPDIVIALVNALPTIAYELVRLLVTMFLVEIPLLAWEFLKMIGQFFLDLIQEIFTFGKAKTETFGDTPGMQYAGGNTRVAAFAQGDYFAAARSPMGVLKQAIEAVKKQGVGAATLGQLKGVGGIAPASTQLPGLMGLSSAMLSMVDAVQSSGATGAQQPLKVVVQAEGETLDSVIFTAQKRGHMPNLKRDFTRASGVKVGFDRGKFQYNS